MPPRSEPDVDVPAGDVKKGAKLYKAKCLQCHTIKKGEGSKSGPNLYNIMSGNRGCGKDKNYGYSGPMKDAAITWTDKHMFEWLLNPKKYVPGNKMVFPGLKKAGERADLIAYMSQEQFQG